MINIKEKLTNRTWAILLTIFLIAFSIRYITRHELLFDPDSYWWYRLAGYYSGVKTEYFYQENGIVKDALAHYPLGRELGGMVGLPVAIGYSFKFLGFFGIQQNMENLMKYMFVFGPVMGGLTVVVAFFLAKELTNKRVAFFSALIYSFSISAMTRNTAGDAGQESLGNLMIFLWIYLFLRASREPFLSRNQVVISSLGALCFSFAAQTWGGNDFYLGLIGTSMGIYILVNILGKADIRTYEGTLLSYGIVILGGIFLPHAIFPVQYLPLFKMYTPVLLAELTAFLSIFILLVHKNMKITPANALLGFFGGTVLVLVLTGKFEAVLLSLGWSYQNLIEGDKGITGSTVAYYRPATYQDFKQTFGILLLAIPLAGAYLLYKYYKTRKFSDLYLLIWLILGIFAFKWMVRLSFILVLPLVIAFFHSLDLAYKHTKKENPVPKKKVKKVVSNQKNKNFSRSVLAGTVLFVLLPVLSSGIAYSSSIKMNDGSVTPWKDAGYWIRENTPEDSLLFHWWDYGYHLQTFAERRTIVDGGNTAPPVEGGRSNRNMDVATMFTSTEDKAGEIISLYNPENRPVYMVVSYAEFGKSGAINYHVNDQLFINSFTIQKSGSPEQDYKTLSEILARNQISTYYVINYGGHYLVWALVQFDGQGNYHPEWGDKLLAKLLPFNTGSGQGLEHFKLVYQNGYVYIYKFT